jgi:hypothetical protein
MVESDEAVGQSHAPGPPKPDNTTHGPAANKI